MEESPKKTTKQPQKNAAVLLLGTIADTTWRMFVPAVGVTVIGVMSDRFFDTTPWLTIVGIVTGSSLSALLVTRQIKQIKRTQK